MTRRTEDLRRRAHELIPGGAHTYSKGDDQFPANAPAFIARGSGSHVWDTDGNEFIDWGMGLRAVLLGHAYPDVVQAASAQLELGQNFVRPSLLEGTLAERLVDLIPSAQMVKFAKNGSDVTTAAVRLARAATGRDVVLVCADHPFFSVDDWFIGSTPMDAGVPQATSAMTRKFRYNDLPSLEAEFASNPGKVAAVILEPIAFTEPAPDFLRDVRDLCTKNGTVLIFDEMITGFRFALRGAQHLFGVTPDLSTFGKALGNGFSVAALVGRREIMEMGGLRHSRPRVFLLSTTHGGETHGLAAALASVERYEALDVAEAVAATGAMLQQGLESIVRELRLSAYVSVEGRSCSPTLMFRDTDRATGAALRTLFMQEMVKAGILIPYIAPSYSHSPQDVSRTLEAAKPAFGVVAQAVAVGPEGLLVGSEVKPVFRRFN